MPDVKKPLDAMRAKGHGNKVRERMMTTDVFVIDEISMCESDFFVRLKEVMKEARNSQAPFGGVQLVVTGDVSSASSAHLQIQQLIHNSSANWRP